MLIHPTLDQLRTMRLEGMARALEEQLQMDDIDDLRFEDRLALLLDREATTRASRRLQTRLRKAKLRQPNACVEDVDYRLRRGLDKSLFLALSSCQWIAQHRNVLITGSTGVGKTYLACALAQKACREDHTVLYLRMPRLFEDLRLAHADGRYPKLMAGLAPVSSFGPRRHGPWLEEECPAGRADDVDGTVFSQIQLAGRSIPASRTRFEAQRPSLP